MSTKMVSKKSKGIVAIVAGGALLLGGGATFALWQDTGTVEGTEITAGSLAIAAEGFTWTYKNMGGTEWLPIEDDFLMIPGQTIRGVATIVPQVDGTDLEATLTYAGGAITQFKGETFRTWKVDGAVKMERAGSAAQTYGPTIDIPNAKSNVPITLEVEMVLPRVTYKLNTDNNAAKFSNGASVWKLADIGLTLTQK